MGPKETGRFSKSRVAWNLLSDGNGGINYAGLEIVCEKIGIDDIDGLLDDFLVIKTYKAPDGTK